MGKDRDAAKEQLWRDRLARQQQGGYSVRDFCQQERIPEHQFYWWRRELKRRPPAKPPGKKQRTRQRDSKTSHRTQQPRQQTAKTAQRTQQAREVTTLLPLHVTPVVAPQNAPIEIILEQPPRVAVTAGFDGHALSQVLDVLESHLTSRVGQSRREERAC